jgi:hypothetical protein
MSANIALHAGKQESNGPRKKKGEEKDKHVVASRWRSRGRGLRYREDNPDAGGGWAKIKQADEERASGCRPAAQG